MWFECYSPLFFCTGTGEVDRSAEGSCPEESAGGVQERHLSAAGSEAAPTEGGTVLYCHSEWGKTDVLSLTALHLENMSKNILFYLIIKSS